MPTDDPTGRTPAGRVWGFQTYADDDAPRDFDGDAWREPEPPSWDEPPDIDRAAPSEIHVEPRRAPLWPKAAVVAAVLAAFGGGFLLARSDPPATIASPESEAGAMAAARPMNVEVAAVAPSPPPPPVSGSARLEVLPTPLGPQARFTPPPAPPGARETPMLSLAPPPPPPAPTPPPTRAPAPVPAPRELAEAPVPSDAVAVARAPVRAPYDCRDAPTRARAMVCLDGGLAAMDRRMKQAYAAAVNAGAPRDALAADQEDWLDVREEAAGHSRRAVADIYRQRIDELRAMAER